MLQNIATEFCIATRLSLSELMEFSKNNLGIINILFLIIRYLMFEDVAALVAAIMKTIEFEKELCTKFQEKERPVIYEDEEEDDGI